MYCYVLSYRIRIRRHRPVRIDTTNRIDQSPCTIIGFAKMYNCAWADVSQPRLTWKVLKTRIRGRRALWRWFRILTAASLGKVNYLGSKEINRDRNCQHFFLSHVKCCWVAAFSDMLHRITLHNNRKGIVRQSPVHSWLDQLVLKLSLM